MNFKELFNKYIDNEATVEEKQIVEQEIEKSRLIHEYLESTMDEQFEYETKIEEDKIEIGKINRDVRKRMIKLIAASVATVFLLLACLQFAVKPLLNNLYYNPDSYSYSKYTNDFGVVVSTYKDLHYPGVRSSGIAVDNVGIGRYALTFFEYEPLKGDRKYHIGNIERGKLTIDIDFWNQDYGYIFTDVTHQHRSPQKQTTKETIDLLEKLPSYHEVIASLTFNRDLSMEEFALIMSQTSAIIEWVGVTTPTEESNYKIIGFVPHGSGPYYEEINKKYPYYEIAEYIHEDRYEAEVFENHFKALLHFQLNNLETLTLMNGHDYYKQYYQSILDNVEKNGVKTYGMLVFGNPKELLQMTNEDYFGDIQIEDIKISFP